MMFQNHCRKCKAPVGPVRHYTYDPLAVEDDLPTYCDACRAAEEQAQKRYLESLSWWRRVLLWWRTRC